MEHVREHEMVEMQVKSDSDAFEDYTTAKQPIRLQEDDDVQEDQTRPFLPSTQKHDGNYRDSINIIEGDVLDIPLHIGEQRQKRRSRYLLSACLGWLFLVTIIVSFQWTGRLPTRAVTWLDGNEKKALVLSTIMKTNVTWLKDIDSDWKVYQYIADDPTATYFTPANKGREAMAYLTFIIDHYNKLPDFMVFMHGDYRAWHQIEPSPYILSALNLSYVEELGYANLRCGKMLYCDSPHHTDAVNPTINYQSLYLRGLHSYAFRPEDPWYDATIPDNKGMRIPPLFAGPCCAQFAVTRAAAQSKPLEFWIRLRALLLVPDLSVYTQEWFGHPPDNTLDWNYAAVESFHLGVTFEVTWHYMFGRPAVDCPDTDVCHQVMYSDRIHCDGWVETGAPYRKDWSNATCTLD